MAGRRVPEEEELLRAGYTHPDFVQRRAVLRETLEAFALAQPPQKFRLLASKNLSRWRKKAQHDETDGHVRICAGDWGEVTHALTKKYGACFAVLNMANAFVPGGGYVEGMPAQEENIFRRTDCHFSVSNSEYDEKRDCYSPEMTRLISAADGFVYLDTTQARTCIRGAEDRSRADLGYPWLSEDQVFPFFELRAAAQDLRGGLTFDEVECRRRISAQLQTLKKHGIRHAVLGAFGCGAFENPSREVARIYKQEIGARLTDFSLIAFAIHSAGYGPGNYEPFAETFCD